MRAWPHRAHFPREWRAVGKRFCVLSATRTALAAATYDKFPFPWTAKVRQHKIKPQERGVSTFTRKSLHAEFFNSICELWNLQYWSYVIGPDFPIE